MATKPRYEQASVAGHHREGEAARYPIVKANDMHYIECRPSTLDKLQLPTKIEPYQPDNIRWDAAMSHMLSNKEEALQ